MAAIDFPNNPQINDIHIHEDVSWSWDGVSWKRLFEDYNFSSKIGIGTSSPQEEIHIKSVTPVIRIEDIDGGYMQIVGNDGSIRFDADNTNSISDTNVRFIIDGSEKFRINHDGKVGIGTNSPDAKLEIEVPSGAGNTNLLKFQRAGGYGQSGFNQFYNLDSGSDPVLWGLNFGLSVDSDTNGKVGIKFESTTGTNATSDKITFRTGYSDKVTIDNTGEIKVGSHKVYHEGNLEVDTAIVFSTAMQDTPEQKWVSFTIPHIGGSGTSNYYYFDVYGYSDIGTMDSQLHYRLYIHVRADGNNVNAINIKPLLIMDDPLGGDASEERFNFYYTQTSVTDSKVWIHLPEDYSALDILSSKLESGGLSPAISSMFAETTTQPSGLISVPVIESLRTEGGTDPKTYIRGSVGIGTATPSRPLHVMDGTNDGSGGVKVSSYLPVIELQDMSGGGTNAKIQLDGLNMKIGPTTSSTYLTLNTEDTERMRIDRYGNVTITGGMLDIAGEINFTGTRSAFIQGLSQPRIYRSGSEAGTYPFNNWGHLVLQARSDSANRDIVLATGTNGANLTVFDQYGNLDIKTGRLKVRSSNIMFNNEETISGAPTADGALFRYDNNFFSSSSDALVIEKTDLNGNNPDGGIAFTNRGADGVVETSMVIKGNGNVGIGTTSPQEKLDVYGDIKLGSWTNDGVIRAWTSRGTDEGGDSTNGSNLILKAGIGTGSGTNGQIEFHTEHNMLNYGAGNPQGSGSAKMVIDYLGNVGIGTSTAAAKLSVAGDILSINNSSPTNLHSDFDSRLNIYKYTSYNSPVGELITIGSQNNTAVANGKVFRYSLGLDGGSQGQDLTISSGRKGQTSLDERMRIDKDGKVGIGTTVPSAPLHVVVPSTSAGGTYAGVFENLSSQDSSQHGVKIIVEPTPNTGVGNYPLVISNDGDTTDNHCFLVRNDGRVDIGYTVGETKLSVAGAVGTQNGSESSPTHTFYSDSDTGAYRPAQNQYAISTGGSERIRVDENGNVGIGTLPSYEFHVRKDQNAKTNIALQNHDTGTSADSEIFIETKPGGGDPFVHFQIDGTESYMIGIDNSDSDKFKISDGYFGTNDRLTIDSNGETVSYNDIRISKSFPKLIIDSPSTSTTGDDWSTEGAMIALGESADDGSGSGTAALYLTYNGNGNSYIGTGGVNSSTGIPLQGYINFPYNSNVVNINGTTNVTGNAYITGSVGIGTSAPTSTYKLSMGGHIDMNNNDIAYVNILHFGNNTRFYDDWGNDQYLTFKWGDTGGGGIRFRDGDSAIQGYIYGDGSGGFGLVSSSFDWGVRIYGNGETQLFYDGSEKLNTKSTGVDITGDLGVSGSITEGGTLLSEKYASKASEDSVTALENKVDEIETKVDLIIPTTVTASARNLTASDGTYTVYGQSDGYYIGNNYAIFYYAGAYAISFSSAISEYNVPIKITMLSGGGGGAGGYQGQAINGSVDEASKGIENGAELWGPTYGVVVDHDLILNGTSFVDVFNPSGTAGYRNSGGNDTNYVRYPNYYNHPYSAEFLRKGIYGWPSAEIQGITPTNWIWAAEPPYNVNTRVYRLKQLPTVITGQEMKTDGTEYVVYVGEGGDGGNGAGGGLDWDYYGGAGGAGGAGGTRGAGSNGGNGGSNGAAAGGYGGISGGKSGATFHIDSNYTNTSEINISNTQLNKSFEGFGQVGANGASGAAASIHASGAKDTGGGGGGGGGSNGIVLIEWGSGV